MAGLAALLAVGPVHAGSPAATASDVRPAKISAAALRPPLPGEQPWWHARRCSMLGIAQSWAGEGAVNCGDSSYGPTREAGVQCLLQAQDAHLSAYLVTHAGASILDTAGKSRELRISTQTLEELRRVSDQWRPAAIEFTAQSCDRFEADRPPSPPRCVAPRALSPAGPRQWACLGSVDQQALPPERRGIGADPIPPGPEAKRGGFVEDPRLPSQLLSGEGWSVTTVEVPRTPMDTAAHVHAKGRVLLLVNSGALEIEVEGRPVAAIYPGEWVYLPQGIPHRIAVVDRASVTVHLAGGASCPELQPGLREMAVEEQVPSWIREPPNPVGAECSRAAVGKVWAGPGAIDCGSASAWEPGTGARCAIWAQEHGRAFYLHEFLQGIDSLPSHAIVRTGRGESFELLMDGGSIDSDGDSVGIAWRACDHFTGPSWRATAERPIRGRSRPISCQPLSDDRRLLGTLGRWSCSAQDKPPGIPEAARAALAVAREKARETPPAPQRGVFLLGQGKLRVQTFRSEGMRCVLRERVPADEVWFTMTGELLRPTVWIEVPQGTSRDRLHAMNVDSLTVLYSRSTDPAPKVLGGNCEYRSVVGGKSFIGKQMTPSRPKPIDIAPPPPGGAPAPPRQPGTVGGM